MVWGKAGSTTLTSAGDDVDITSLAEGTNRMIMSHMINSGACQNKVTFNDTGSSKYASRNEYNDDADSTQINQNFVPHWDGNDNASNDQFVVSFLSDIDGEEKLGLYWGIDRGTAGTNTIRSRNMVYKYINTPKITRLDLHNQGAGSYDTGSNFTALGSDVTPVVAVPALDNVQDNSLFVDKVNANRYWFDAESTSNVTWNDSTDVGCSISGNTITKTASNGWTSGIGQTDQQVSASNGGTITITSNATNSFVGLSNVTSLNQQAKTWFDIKFGFSDEEIIENGAQITPDTAFSRATSDTMKITISSAGLVKYFVNDSLKHTSTITASGSYFGIFAAYTQNENMTATITTPSSWTQEWTGSPNSVADLQGWWDASASDSTISLLVDKSGNGYNLTQGTSARQPSVVSGAQNSLNALQFAPNVGGSYNSEMMQNTSMPNAKSQTVFYVGKVTKTTGGSSGYNYYIWDTSSNENYNGMTQRQDTWRIYAGNSVDVTETTWGVWRNLTMKYDGSNSILRDRGSQETVALTLEGSTDTGFTLNGYANGGSYGGTQDFGELIVYNRALTDTEITNVESYLTTKWGL